MSQERLFMLVVGCKPAGRHTEQHDVFFGIGDSLKSVAAKLDGFWPDSGKLHIDSWREVNVVNGYRITVTNKSEKQAGPSGLFFLNLGGYKPGDMEEYHYKMLSVAASKGEAIKAAKETVFYKHTGFKGAEAHIDDKYGVDVDDVYEIEEILTAADKAKYHIVIHAEPGDDLAEDIPVPGYVKMSSFKF